MFTTGNANGQRRDHRFHNGRRRVFTKLIKDKDAVLTNVRDGQRFIEGMDTFDDKASLLLAIIDPGDFGLKRIRDVLSFVGSLNDVEQLVVPLLAHIMHVECARPLNLEMRNKVLSVIVGVPGFLEALNRFSVATLLNTRNANLLCSFLLASTRALLEARISTAIMSISKDLKARGDIEEAKILCAVILVDEVNQDKPPVARVEKPKDVATWVTDTVPPGGRHDNDHFNYRNIQIVPTPDELKCQSKPYLPLANGGNRMFDDPCTALLDSNFRLLREDAVHTMRQNILNRDRSWPNARVVGLYHGRTKGKSTDSVFFIMQFDSPKNINWERSRLLLEGSVVVLCKNSEPIRLGTIVYRETHPAWMNCKSGARFGVQFESEDDFTISLDEMFHNNMKNISLAELRDGNHDANNLEKTQALLQQMTTYDLVEASKSFFSYRPILETLQSMDRIPLLEELSATNGSEGPSPLDYLPQEMKYPFSDFQCKLDSWDSASLSSNTTLDMSQADALRHAFTSRVAVIQGPPGTGKTYIGSLIAQMIRKNTDEKILCVCYTNHALDQFLEQMLDYGENRIVRLGGKSKSDRLEMYNIRNLKRQKTDHIGSNIKKIDAMIHEQNEILQRRMKQTEVILTWEVIKRYLRDFFPDALECLTAPCPADGFRIFGSNGKDLNASSLWTFWSEGKDFPEWLSVYYKDNPPDFLRFWQMPHQSRVELIDEWRKCIVSNMTDGIYGTIKELKELQATKESWHEEKLLEILRGARIIGATTSGAAIHKHVLDVVGASIVIVEEAGEVLESHILTALSATNLNEVNGTKHLLLIGDHKQLRPKVEDYELTTVSGNGYNLDCSLFERLILNGSPSASLAVQHRMRPCISAIIRQQTYPFLIDHPSVLNFPHVKGLTKDMLFLNHRFQEDNMRSEKVGISESSTSKSNTREAQLTLCVVRYLLLQGYQPSQIVILTPYLSQLVKISKLMTETLNDIAAYVDDKDRNEIADLAPEMLDMEINKKTAGSLRCSSVDNFQGEESDIVVISMVRSNRQGNIGFLKEEQRVNVMLSRARHGMIVIGNADTLKTSARGKAIWEPILRTFEMDGQLLKGLPTFCQLHPNDEPMVLTSVLDFQTFRPNGGCQRKCNYRLLCGHGCPQMCHPIDKDHRVAQRQCTQPCKRVPSACERSHSCPKLCNEVCGPCSFNMGPVELPCSHIAAFAKCHETRNVSALQQLQLQCEFKVNHKFIPCGHNFETTCNNALATTPKCPAVCSILMLCGHNCCSSCGHELENHKCSRLCERMLFCGHVCNIGCHGSQPCKPCEKPCDVHCVHSKCSAKCNIQCASCVEPCDWECEHEGRCALVCGAPCSRLPCSKRCSKKLACGHQCPSVCGENCPSVKFCHTCANDDVKDQVVDVINLSTYAKHDVDKDPVFVLPCNHVYSMSTLDGHLGLLEVYEQDSETQRYTGTKSLRAANVSERPRGCPNCRTTLQSIGRYGRLLKLSQIRCLERKHMMVTDNALNYLDRSLKEQNVPSKKLDHIVAQLLKCLESVKKGPMRVVYEACAGGMNLVEVPPPPARPLIRCLELLATSYSKRIETKGDEMYNKSCITYRSAIDEAMKTKSIYSGILFRLALVKLLNRWSVHGDNDIDEETKLHLDWIEENAQVYPEALTEVKTLRERDHKKELQDIMQAMSISKGYDYGGTASSRWYECPNGHPYFIGECGGAMQQSKCIECGEIVGGGGHRLVSTNRAIGGVYRDAIEGNSTST